MYGLNSEGNDTLPMFDKQPVILSSVIYELVFKIIFLINNGTNLTIKLCSKAANLFIWPSIYSVSNSLAS